MSSTAASSSDGKAIIANARKLLKIIYDTLKNAWVFEDFPALKVAGNFLLDLAANFGLLARLNSCPLRG